MSEIKRKIEVVQMTALQARMGNFNDIQMIPSQFAKELINESLDNVIKLIEDHRNSYDDELVEDVKAMRI